MMDHLSGIQEELAHLRAQLSRPEAALVDRLLQRLSCWHQDASTAEELVEDLDRILGHTWFESDETHAAVASIIARLRETVASIEGMTMNERLFTFNLTDRWDDAPNIERGLLYKKVLADR